MLQIEKLTITHRKDLRVILEEFQMVLNDGDKAVIIGEEGNGKSTLMKWIYDPELVEHYAECEGRRITGGEKLGYLPQELPAGDRKKTVYEFFAEEPFFYEQTPRELAMYAREFHVDQEFFYLDQRMERLSGGEKIKAQMMRLLMQQPTVLLLDEPSNDIDIQTLEWLEKIINEWPHIVLYISHDETLIENTANMVIHMEQIQRKTQSRYTVAHMPYRQYVEERLHKFEKQEQQAASDRREKKIRDEKYRKIYQSVEHAQASISRQDPFGAKLLKKKMHSVKSMEKRFAREDENMTEMPEQEEAIFFKLGDAGSAVPAGKTVLEYKLDQLTIPTAEQILAQDTYGLDQLTMPATEQVPAQDTCGSDQLTTPAVEQILTQDMYKADQLAAPDGGRVLAKNIFLRMRGPEKICIIGTNGCGKTTLLKKIAQELLARTDIRAEYMPQNYEELLDLTATPVDFLDKTGDKEERTRIRTYLGSLKYTADEMEHPIAELSGGQKAKIFLLKMSLSGANVLILDEPTRNFSPLSGPVIRKMLREFPGAIISISHDRKYIEECCEKVYRLDKAGLQEAADLKF